MSDGFSCIQGTRRKNRPTENKGLNYRGAGGVKYTQTQVTLALMATMCTSSQPLHLPPGLGWSGSRTEVAKLAVVWHGEGEAGRFQAPPPSRRPASSQVKSPSLPRRPLGKAQEPQARDTGSGQGNPSRPDGTPRPQEPSAVHSPCALGVSSAVTQPERSERMPLRGWAGRGWSWQARGQAPKR